MMSEAQYWSRVLAENLDHHARRGLSEKGQIFGPSTSPTGFVSALSLFARALESGSYLSQGNLDFIPWLKPSLSRHLDDLEWLLRERQPWWSPPSESSQEIVEASSLALGLLSMSGELLERARSSSLLIDWFHQLRASNTKNNNWRFFSLVFDSFLPEDPAETRRKIVATFDSPLFDQKTGWFQDGPDGPRDYYSSFVAHFIPHLLLILDPDTREREIEPGRLLLARYVRSLACLIHSSGAPVLFGRSLHYTTAIAAPFSIFSLLSKSDKERFDAGTVVGLVHRYFSRNVGKVGFPSTLSWGFKAPKLVENYAQPSSSLWSNRIFAPLLFPQNRQGFFRGVSHSGRYAEKGALADFQDGFTAVSTPFILDKPKPSNPTVILGNGHNVRASRLNMGQKIQDRFDRLAYSSHTEPIRSSRLCDNSWSLHRGGLVYRLSPMIRVSSPQGSRRFRAGVDVGHDWETSDEEMRNVILDVTLKDGKRVDRLLLPPNWAGGTVEWTGWAVGSLFGFAWVHRSRYGPRTLYSISGHRVATDIEVAHPHTFKSANLISRGVFAKFFTVPIIRFETDRTMGEGTDSLEVTSILRLVPNKGSIGPPPTISPHLERRVG